MKKIILVGVIFLLIHCENKTGEHELNMIINSYENYQSSKKEEYPLGNYTESRFETYANFCDSLKNRLQEIDPKKLNDDAQISYSLLDFSLNEAIVRYKFKTHWNPILSDGGFHSSLTYRVRPLTNKKSALKYLKLLKAIPQYISQQSALIKKGFLVKSISRILSLTIKQPTLFACSIICSINQGPCIGFANPG